MGRGDKRTKKGKITRGSFGVSRPKASKIKSDKVVQPPVKTAKEA